MALRMHVARENRTPLRFAHTATSTTNVKLWLIPSQRRALSALDELARAGPISVRRAWKRWARRARRAGQVRWARSPGEDARTVRKIRSIGLGSPLGKSLRPDFESPRPEKDERAEPPAKPAPRSRAIFLAYAGLIVLLCLNAAMTGSPVPVPAGFPTFRRAATVATAAAAAAPPPAPLPAPSLARAEADAAAGANADAEATVDADATADAEATESAAPVEAALLGPRRRALRAANKARRGVLKAAQNTAKKIARPIRGLGKKIGMKIARPFRALRLGKRMKSRRQ